MYFQEIITTLNKFWQEKGCLIIHGYDIEKGAATLAPMSFFPALNPQPCKIAYVDPCRRPIDSRYGSKESDRYQQYYQYQIIIKPPLEEPQEIFTQSLKVLGFDLSKNKLKFLDDAWVSPVFGAEGMGWEVWLNNSEIAQITYLNKVGGVSCPIVPLEITYGLERLAMELQSVDSFQKIQWNGDLTYGDLFQQAEFEGSIYCLEKANVNRHFTLLELYLQETEFLIHKNLVYPALDYLLKSAHSFNIIDSRQGFIGNQKNQFLEKIRFFAQQIAQKYLSNY